MKSKCLRKTTVKPNIFVVILLTLPIPKLSLLANRRASPAGIAGGARCNAPQNPPLSVVGMSGTLAFGTALLFASR